MLHHIHRSLTTLRPSKTMESLPDLVSKMYQSAYGNSFPAPIDIDNKHLLFTESTAKIVTNNNIQVRPPSMLMVVFNPLCSRTTTQTTEAGTEE
jgi:hypothetical protein